MPQSPRRYQCDGRCPMWQENSARVGTPNMNEHFGVGIVGIGLLGSAISERLLTAGLDVYGYDTDPSQLETFSQRGGFAVDSSAALIRQCPTVVFCLPSSETVSTLVAQRRPEFQSGQIVIDTTTGDPEQMIANGRSLAELGVEYIEATVAGSSAQMRDGKVVLFLGGKTEVVGHVQTILDALTDKHFFLGPIGSASRMKLVHNLVLGLHRAVLAEGLMFAKGLGIDPGQALKILRQTPAASTVMESKGERMVSGDFQPQARLAQHLKDVRLILTESERRNCKTPLSELHQRLLESAVESGFGELDNSAIIRVFQSFPESRE